jgi:predicted acylesterase/phospholipase RssA
MLKIDPITFIVISSLTIFIGYRFQKQPFRRDLLYILLLIGCLSVVYYIRSINIVTVEAAMKEAFKQTTLPPIKEPANKPKLKTPKTNLVVQGSGAGLIAMAGALYALKYNEFTKNVKKVAGVSSGSLLVYMIALGYSEEEILRIVYHFNGDSLFDKNLFSSLRGLWSKCGFYSNEPLRIMVRMLEARKDMPENLTFEQLFEKRKIELFVVAVNINKSKTVVFSVKDTPNVAIRDAVCASMAVPYFFEPMRIKMDGESEADVYVDGAMGINFPLYLFKGELSNTIGFKITDIYTKRDKEIYYPNHTITNIANYSAALMIHNLFQLERLYLDLTDDFWNHVIGVPFDGANALKFDISSDEKLKVMQTSFNEAIKQIENENKSGRFESMRLPPAVQGQLKQMSATVRNIQLSPVDSLSPTI